MTSIWVTTDIGGSDPDDYQSMIHLMHVYMSQIMGFSGGPISSTDPNLDFRGITAGAPRGKRSAAIEVINAAITDCPNSEMAQHFHLLRYSTYKGGKKAAKTLASESNLHIPSNPLVILVWGACTDLAQAIKAGLVEENCFAYIIGSWNADQDRESYNFVASRSKLRKILNNSTFRGMYLHPPAGLNNKKIITEVGKFGALGKLLIEKSQHINTGKGSLKAGDTPSLLWAMTHKNLDPTRPSWGGRFRKVNATTWTDLEADRYKLGSYRGAKTVSRYQAAVRKDWLARCRSLYGGE